MIPCEKPTFVFEMANNHQGSVAHGQRVVREFAAVAKRYPEFDFAFKLQYRDLDTFIHPKYQGRMDIGYVSRFTKTRLEPEQFQAILATIREEGLRTVVTPFDEPSVDRIEEHGVDVVKIASCSLTDWPLLERVAKSNLPVIASTAGATIEDVDRVVSFLQHRGKRFALMHCVADYPTPDEGLALGQIDLLRERYPSVEIGYSTHEDPGTVLGVTVAVAKGARLFEKHVGVPLEGAPLNAYSANPEQVDAWLAAARKALAVCGSSTERVAPSAGALASLDSLRRGVYVTAAVAAGTKLTGAHVHFAFPPEPGQWLANDWSKHLQFVTTEAIPEGGAVTRANTTVVDLHERIRDIASRVKALFARSSLPVPGGVELEISHHYGLERFDEVGMTILTVVNREYCKKLLALLPGQHHPEQYHEQKEETFHLLFGELTLVLDGVPRELTPGDVVTIQRGVRHAMHTASGAIVEEISSTHHVNDSFYTDASISANPNRKTFLKYWMD